MTPVERYLRRKAELTAAAPTRNFCLRCRKPALTCYCADLAPVATSPRIVVLMHPLEAKHPVGTGRLAHRMLSNSHFYVGIDFSAHAGVKALLQDPKLYPIVLYPGAQSRDLSKMNVSERQALLPAGREPVVFLLDGTWNLAKKILTHTPALQTLPRICFTPSRPSRFLLRKQPRVQCFSTIEAIHETITLLSPEPGPHPHDVLLDVFDRMVARQLSFKKAGPSRHKRNSDARKAKAAARAAAELAPKPAANLGPPC